MWIKAVAVSVGAFISTALGIKVAQAKTAAGLKAPKESQKENREAMEKSHDARITAMERSFQRQFTSMGREIGELKGNIKSIHDDIYKPRFDDK